LGISFKITERKSGTHYRKFFFLGSIIRKDFVYSWQPFLYHNKEKLCQTYEISKEWGCLITAASLPPKHHKGGSK